MKILQVALLFALPLVVAGQDVGVNETQQGTNETTAPPPQEEVVDTTSSSVCSCEGCPDQGSVAVGLHKDLLSPECPEGSVATVTKLRTADRSGTYDLVTWNSGSFFEYNLNPNFIYQQASATAKSCYEADPSILPVVGDQSTIEVKMDCKRVYCSFEWDVQFGCAELGVLTTSANGGLQVLSDVDDTITCANPSTTCDSVASCTLEGTVSHYLAGIDRRLEHKEMYPGVAEVMIGLAWGPQDGNNGQYYPAKTMMLSARPREAEVILAIDQDSELNVYFESVGGRLNQTSWGVNTDSSMYGTLSDGVDFTKFGATKAASFDSVSSERPNTQFAFMGDNGQGDVCAAQSMIESTNGDRMAVVLIHDVRPKEEALTKCESPEGVEFTLNLPESNKVHYHKTHSNAATWLLEKGLISCCSASHVWYAVAEWMECRCDGICSSAGLNTGVSTQATRNETMAYCAELEVDQQLLLTQLDVCDPNEECPGLGDLDREMERSLASTVGSGLLVGASLWLLVLFGI